MPETTPGAPPAPGVKLIVKKVAAARLNLKQGLTLPGQKPAGSQATLPGQKVKF